MFRFLRPVMTVVRLSLLWMLAGTLIACKSGSSDSDSDSRTISGNAVKGVLINGIVRAFQTIPGSNQRIALGNATTNQKGEFSLKLIQVTNTLQSPILLEFEADNDSEMICDVIPSCLNPFDGSLYDFGEAMPLDPDFMMLGLADDQQAYLSPLSHILVTTAQRMPGGLTPENIQSSSQQVTQMFSLPRPVLETKTADLSALSELSDVSDAELSQAIWSAAFYDLTQSNDWADQAYDLSNLPLNQIYGNAIALTDHLSASMSDSETIATPSHLGTFRQQAQTKFDAIASDTVHFVYQPMSLALNEGETIILRALATSSDDEISYQWLRDNQPINGENQATLNIYSSQLSDQGNYSVVASNGSNAITSEPVFVQIDKVIQALTISTQPVSQYIQLNQPFTLFVEATGEGELSFQWQKNGSIIPGATSASYGLQNASFSDGGSYRVIISNEYEEVASSFVDIIVNEELQPVSIIEHPKALSVVEGMAANFAVSANGGGYLSYQWYKDGSALQNANASQLNIEQTTTDDGGLYSVTIANSLGSLDSEIVELEIIPSAISLSIFQQPTDKNIHVNDSVSFSVGASGQGLISYQWLFNDEPIEGATSASYQITNAQAVHAGNYSVLVTDDLSNLLSNIANLTVEGPRQLHLSWGIPTQRENGDALDISEIGGYVLEYGQNQEALENRVEINSPNETYYTITNLPQGTLYLRMATVDHLGVQGAFSDTVAINIP